jgi:maltose alpha-D-glucosyltransferase/alpha-amylase
MGFHFPLMPRLYMALAQEVRHPITDIIRQTPEIPEDCQWGIFLRNHDELTLEMVTAEERDYLWRTYAADRRARINLGIRRRLAPLLQNDRRKIELMNSLLMSMSGTPIVYYGDEIGMGDNYYLGDRDGVRTPMQWSADRNAGFSRVSPQQLYLPAIQDPVYGYQAINVESQNSDPSSLLNWVRRLIAVRRQHRSFGRGTMTLIYPRNRKVLCYVREFAGERILCVANLSRAAQAAEIDLSRYKGAVPIELMGHSAFPPIGDLPYLVTLPAYGFFWFLLNDEATAPGWHEQMPEILPDFITLTTRDGLLMTALSGREKAQLDTDVLPQFLPLQRWFGAKDEKLGKVTLTPLAELKPGEHALAVVDVEIGGETQRYFLPLSARWGEASLTTGAPKLSYTLAKIRRGPLPGALVDGVHDENLAHALLEAMRDNATLAASEGTVVFEGTERLLETGEIGEPRPLGVEQSNVSIAYGDRVILKLFRRLRAGKQPDVEMSRFLSETAGFANTPAFLGSIEHRPASGEVTTLAAAYAFVANQGDAWAVLTDALDRDLQDHLIPLDEREPPEDREAFGGFLTLGALLGRRTAELHNALASATDDPDFALEPVTKADLKAWSDEAVAETEAMLKRLAQARGGLTDKAAPLVERILAGRSALISRLKAPAKMKPSGFRSRIHGDYHLGQVLVAQDDVMIIDFEGEPKRTLSERRAKSSPLRDVAGMLRSFHYAAETALGRRLAATGAIDEETAARAELWYRTAGEDFLAAYRTHLDEVEGGPSADLSAALTDLFVIQKAIYEVGYELANRPDWLAIPLAGVADLIDGEGA